jgi:6-phospho-beta-glucosidase
MTHLSGERLALSVLGGSSVGTPQLISDIIDLGERDKEFAFREIRLYGRAAERLGGIIHYVSELLEKSSNPAIQRMRVTPAYTLEQALTGADIILCQLRIGRMDGRARDETAAVAAGFPGDGTWGPSGLSSYLRGRAALESYAGNWVTV